MAEPVSAPEPERPDELIPAAEQAEPVLVPGRVAALEPEPAELTPAAEPAEPVSEPVPAAVLEPVWFEVPVQVSGRVSAPVVPDGTAAVGVFVPAGIFAPVAV
ncbi:MAG: hypothetical protein WC701_13285 [Kiritimatiellales bacterium]